MNLLHGNSTNEHVEGYVNTFTQGVGVVLQLDCHVYILSLSFDMLIFDIRGTLAPPETL